MVVGWLAARDAVGCTGRSEPEQEGSRWLTGGRTGWAATGIAGEEVGAGVVLSAFSRHIQAVGPKRVEIEAIAQRVAERLATERQNGQPPLVDAAAVARLLGVSRDTVYAHADELGAIRLGSGDRARLRFDPRGLVAGRGPTDSRAASVRPGRRGGRTLPGSRSGGQLLPIRPAARRGTRRPSGERGRS